MRGWRRTGVHVDEPGDLTVIGLVIGIYQTTGRHLQRHTPFRIRDGAALVPAVIIAVDGTAQRR